MEASRRDRLENESLSNLNGYESLSTDDNDSVPTIASTAEESERKSNVLRDSERTRIEIVSRDMQPAVQYFDWSYQNPWAE